jgi:Tol biopolymer transport system component
MPPEAEVFLLPVWPSALLICQSKNVSLYFPEQVASFTRGDISMSNLKRYLLIILTGAAVILSSLAVACAPAVSYQPSGLPSLLCFTSDRNKTVHIYTAKPDGTNLKSTSSDNQTFDGLCMWSPDGTRIAFSSNQADDYEIWTMGPDGSNRQKLTGRKGLDTVPRYSPNMKRIVFASEFKEWETEEEHATYEIMVMDADGSNLTRLTTSKKTSGGWNGVPTWSPDSSKILFGSNREGNPVIPVLYIMNADGSNQQKFGFIFPVEGTEPDWSPVTNKIVFVKGSIAKGDIWVMDAGSPFPGLTAKKLTDNIDNNHSPVWSPDGSRSLMWPTLMVMTISSL